MKKDENGQLLEPVEEVVVDVDEEFSGVVVEKLGQKRAELIEMIPSQVGQQSPPDFPCTVPRPYRLSLRISD